MAGLVVVLVLAVTAVIAVVAVWRPTPTPGPGSAGKAMVTASSASPGFSAGDVVTSGSVSDAGAVWQSNDETIGAWVELSWSQAHDLRQLTVVRNSLTEPGITNGFLTFEDGSLLQFVVSTTSPTTLIGFTPRRASRVRITVTGVDPGAQHVTIAEILAGTHPSAEDVVIDEALDGNAARSAVATQSAGSQTPNPTALQDGSGAPGPAGTGADWVAPQSSNSWVQRQWAEPRELTSVAVVGSASAPAALARGHSHLR